MASARSTMLPRPLFDITAGPRYYAEVQKQNPVARRNVMSATPKKPATGAKKAKVKDLKVKSASKVKGGFSANLAISPITQKIQTITIHK